MKNESLIHKILRKLGIIKKHKDDRRLKMEMCREQYSQCEFNKLVIPKTDENLAKVSISLTGNVVNQIAEKYVFQFPKEEEIE